MASSTASKAPTTTPAAATAVAPTSGTTKRPRPTCSPPSPPPRAPPSFATAPAPPAAAAAHLFPTFARSLRATSFGYDLDGAGALHFRENLPHKEPLWGFAAADGTMGQIMHAYLDWTLSGDLDWLRG